MQRFITIKGVSDIMAPDYRGVNGVQEQGNRIKNSLISNVSKKHAS